MSCFVVFCMSYEPHVVAFSIAEPFDIALRMLRRALERAGLRVPAEVNVSNELRSELGLELRDNIVLYVDTSLLLLEATLLTGAGALYVPEPVALTGFNSESRVVVRSVRSLLDDSLPVSARRPILQLHERIVRAIHTVGRPEPVCPDPQTAKPAAGTRLVSS